VTQGESILLTVFESSLPISIVRRQRGIISVERRKFMTSVSSTCMNNPQIHFCTFCNHCPVSNYLETIQKETTDRQLAIQEKTLHNGSQQINEI
jgi:hypothetical protein